MNRADSPEARAISGKLQGSFDQAQVEAYLDEMSGWEQWLFCAHMPPEDRQHFLARVDAEKARRKGDA